MVKVEMRCPTDTDASCWWLTCVYGPHDDATKTLFLDELEAIRDECSGPWAICGDFNLILSEADKNNERINRANLSRFRRAVQVLQLHDLHLHGRAFTWSNERDHPTLVRLDRVLVTMDWESAFPNAHLRCLSADASDHCPLLLHTNLGSMSKARFHFEAFWPKFNDYVKLSRPPGKETTEPFFHCLASTPCYAAWSGRCRAGPPPKLAAYGISSSWRANWFIA
jgi:hypothetical protein